MTSLLTWIWQGLALTLGIAGFIRLRRSLGAGARLVLWWAALGAVLLLPIAGEVARHFGTAPSTGVDIGAGQPAAVAFAPVMLPAPSDWLVAMAIGAWLGYVLVTLVRLVRAGLHLGWLKRRATPVAAARQARLPLWMSIRAAGRRVVLCESDDLAVPAALGLGRPTILLPRAIVSGLSDADLDQIVLHEYSHLRRRDDWSRVVQTLVKAVAGFHPAVWWIGGQIDVEREAACDEFVVRRTGSARRYAACLARTAELVAEAATAGADAAHALAPGAAGSRRQLTLRVKRLLDHRALPLRTRSAILTLAVGLAGLTAGVAMLARVDPLVTVAGPDGVVAPVPPPAPLRRTSTIAAAMPAVVPTVPPSAIDSEPSGPAAAEPERTPAGDSLRTALGAGRSEFAMPGAPLLSSVSLPLVPALEATSFTAVVQTVDSGWSPAAAASADSVSATLTPWLGMADAGTSVGLGARKAGVATAGFFTKLGRSIAGVF